MKVLNWILNHLKIVLAIVVFGVTLGVVGGSMLGSYNSYIAYEKKYNENDLAVRSAAEAAPKKAEIMDNFSSKLKNKVVATKDDLVVTSGTVGDEEYISALNGTMVLTIELAEKSLVDLDLEMRSAYKDEEDNTLEVKDLLSVIHLRVNGSLMEDEINLPAEDWHHLVLSGFALPKGTTTIELESINGKTQFMPDVMSITFYSNETATIAA